MPVSYARHRFPTDVIRHAVWLYLRFTLSYRDVEDLLAERGLDIIYETVRRWAGKFGNAFARELRRGKPSPRWHLDEMVVRIGGELCTCGERMMTKEKCSISWSNVAAIGVPPFGLCANSWRKPAWFRTSCDGQAALLWGGIPRARPDGAPCAGAAHEQQSREFSPAGPTTRAQDAALPIGRIRPTLPFSSRRRRHQRIDRGTDPSPQQRWISTKVHIAGAISASPRSNRRRAGRRPPRHSQPPPASRSGVDHCRRFRRPRGRPVRPDRGRACGTVQVTLPFEVRVAVPEISDHGRPRIVR